MRNGSSLGIGLHGCSGDCQTSSAVNDEAEYICDACGEAIVIPVDLTQGQHQQYGEDCPVCCRPHLITVEIDPDGSVRAWAERE